MTRDMLVARKSRPAHRSDSRVWWLSRDPRPRCVRVCAQCVPSTGYHDSLIEPAAAMMESLAINHPFVDGNKRVAFAATDAFLRLNGHFIDCDSDAAYALFLCMFMTGSFRFAELRLWLEENVKLSRILDFPQMRGAVCRRARCSSRPPSVACRLTKLRKHAKLSSGRERGAKRHSRQAWPPRKREFGLVTFAGKLGVDAPPEARAKALATLPARSRVAVR